MVKPTSALVYNRKSRGELEDLSKHKKELLDYCERNNFNPMYFEEIGSSVDSDREEFIKLIKEIKTGKYDVLVITDLSRLTRDLETQIKLFKLLTNYNMTIHSLMDGKINPAESTNKMMGILKGLFNESAYEETSKKMHLGRLQSARDGKWVGQVPYGYKKNKEAMKLEPDEIEAPVVRRIFKEVLEGHSITEISLRLHKDGIKTRKGNNFHPSTISNLLERRTYIGETNFKSDKFGEDVTLKGTHEPLVSMEDYLRVRKVLEKKQHFQMRTHPVTSPLDKLIFCGKCGRLMQVNLAKKKYIHLQKCNAYKYGDRCENSGCSLNLILPYVYEQVQEHLQVFREQLALLNKGSSNEKLEELKKELKGLEKQLKNKENEKDKLLNFLLNGTINELIYTNKNKELENEINKLKRRIEDTEETIANSNISNDTEYLESLIKNLEEIKFQPVEEQNRHLRGIIEKIIYVREDDRIDLNIQFKD
ncbi:hypothetical protein UACE39S_04921 [Ureibacillus acetophenoni]